MHFSVAEMVPVYIYFEFSVTKHSYLNSECSLGCEITQRVMASVYSELLIMGNIHKS